MNASSGRPSYPIVTTVIGADGRTPPSCRGRVGERLAVSSDAARAPRESRDTPASRFLNGHRLVHLLRVRSRRVGTGFRLHRWAVAAWLAGAAHLGATTRWRRLRRGLVLVRPRH